MKENKVGGVMGATIEKIREIVDVSTIVGDPMELGPETTIIPVSKVTYGFASGGSDLPTKSQSELFAGGGGAGVTIQPIAFLVIQNGSVKLMEISKYNDSVDRAVAMAPEMVDKIQGIVSSFRKKGDKKDEK